MLQEYFPGYHKIVGHNNKKFQLRMKIIFLKKNTETD